MDLALFSVLKQIGLLQKYGILALDEYGPFKEPGFLGLPKPDLERITSPNDFQSRVFVLFSKILENRNVLEGILSQLRVDPTFANEPLLTGLLNEAASSNAKLASLLSEIRGDPRVDALEGQCISTGSSSMTFEKSRLEMWYIWSANEFGLERAREQLNEWLDADEVDVLNVLWVRGPELDEEIQISDNYKIVPARTLPDSTHKEQALRFEIHLYPWNSGPPTAAITRVCKVKKTYPKGELPTLDSNPDFWIAGQRLYDIALVLNVLPEVSCQPTYASSYSLPIYPFGPFAGSGGGGPVYDVIGRKQTKITKEQQSDIQAALDDFDRLQSNQRDRFRRILSRLSQAKRRSEIEDKVLDLGIILEMLLLADNSNKEQLALTFRLRGAWLVSNNKQERLENYRLLKDIYTHRSHVAHTGLLEGGNIEKIMKVQEQFPYYEALTEKICRHILSTPKINWEVLVLGSSET